MDDLVTGLKAGRPEAYERLVRDYGDRLYRFALRLVGARWAEDAVQEVFIRVHRSIGAWRPTGRFESWLFAVANNLCVDWARRRKPQLGLPPEAEAAGPGPAEALDAGERRRAIVRAVEALPTDQKQVFLLRHEAGLPFREIAEILGCPLNTALGRMHYAMERLRKALETHGMP